MYLLNVKEHHILLNISFKVEGNELIRTSA